MDLSKLYPKYNCPVCHDWFHMPWKFCKCGNQRRQREIQERHEKWRRTAIGIIGMLMILAWAWWAVKDCPVPKAF